MDPTSRSWSFETWAELVRRAHVVVRHLRYHGQVPETREVVQRVLGGAGARAAQVAPYRALLEEAVESFIRGFR